MRHLPVLCAERARQNAQGVATVCVQAPRAETLVSAICLVNGILWPEAARVHHAFRLADAESGRVLQGTLEIHTLELGRYTLREADLTAADMLDCWLYWLLHAHEYEPAALLQLLPQQAIRQATETLARISEISEDKAMYDAREKAIRDRKWELNSAFREGEREGEIKGKIEGEIKGKIELIRTLQVILQTSVSEEQELRAMTLEQLESLTGSLQEQLRNRTPSWDSPGGEFQISVPDSVVWFSGRVSGVSGRDRRHSPGAPQTSRLQGVGLSGCARAGLEFLVG